MCVARMGRSALPLDPPAHSGSSRVTGIPAAVDTAVSGTAGRGGNRSSVQTAWLRSSSSSPILICDLGPPDHPIR